MRTNIGAKALAVFMVAVMVLSTVLVFNNSSGESGDPVVPLAEPQSPISVEVVYHPYEPGKAPNVTDVPTNYKSIFGYNTTVGLDGTTVSVTCHGGVISTEGNPQTWSHTQWFKPITEDQFGTHDLYVAHMTHVFTGWKYKKDGGSIKNQIYNPGEVFEYKEDGFWYAKNVTSPGSSDSKLDTTDGKIHVYATWATVEQVLENGESVDLLNYILFGNSRFDYTGSTLPKRLSSAFVTKSGSSYVDASTRDIASDKDSFGRSFVRNVYEKLNLEGDSSTGYKMKLWGEYHNVRTDSVVVDSDVDIYYDESTRNLYVDGYNCTYLESGNTIYLCFY